MKTAFLQLICISALLLVSCQKTGEELQPEIPVSIASSDETAEIDNAVSEIQEISNKLKLGHDFRSFPVRVVETYPSPSENEPLAFCQQDKDGNGLYIGILKSTMDIYKTKFKPQSGHTMLFLTLVHEYGHCLFERVHDDELISVPGLNFYFRNREGSNDYILVGGQLPVSAMNTNGGLLSANSLPIGVRTYYLSEVLGIFRWRDRKDLEETEDLKLVPTNH